MSRASTARRGATAALLASCVPLGPTLALMLRSVILAAAHSPRVEKLVETAPVSRDVVRRFVAGTSTEAALAATRELVTTGIAVTLDNLGEDVFTAEQAEATKEEYLRLLAALSEAEL